MTGKIVTIPFLSVLAVCLWVEQSQVAAAQTNLCEGLHGNSAIAQSCQPLAGQRFLTVIGQGQVTVPADTALMEFRFANRDQPGMGMDVPGVSIQTARQFTEDALQPVVTALRGAGIPAANINIQTSSIQNPILLVKIDKPTQEGLQQTVLTVDQSLKSSQQLFLQSIGAGYLVNNCEPLQRSARRIALQDARSQIKTLAQDVSVELGELFSVTVLPLMGSSASLGCGSKVGVPVSPLSFSTNEATPSYNPADKPEVQVRSQVSITHTIQSKDLVQPR